MSLEDPFWDAFRRIAKDEGIGINELAAQIDTARGTTSGLASAIRIFVLRETEKRLPIGPDDG